MLRKAESKENSSEIEKFVSQVLVRIEAKSNIISDFYILFPYFFCFHSILCLLQIFLELSSFMKIASLVNFLLFPVKLPSLSEFNWIQLNSTEIQWEHTQTYEGNLNGT